LTGKKVYQAHPGLSCDGNPYGRKTIRENEQLNIRRFSMAFVTEKIPERRNPDWYFRLGRKKINLSLFSHKMNNLTKGGGAWHL
jgi:hypothetical protein